jgi:hypothetical protein
MRRCRPRGIASSSNAADEVVFEDNWDAEALAASPWSETFDPRRVPS